jgi:hypothetical protein
MAVADARSKGIDEVGRSRSTKFDGVMQSTIEQFRRRWYSVQVSVRRATTNDEKDKAKEMCNVETAISTV